MWPRVSAARLSNSATLGGIKSVTCGVRDRMPQAANGAQDDQVRSVIGRVTHATAMHAAAMQRGVLSNCSITEAGKNCWPSMVLALSWQIASSKIVPTARWKKL